MKSGDHPHQWSQKTPHPPGESEPVIHPGGLNAFCELAGGNMLAAFFGLSASKDIPNYTLRVAVRPGLVRFGRAWTTSPQTVILPSQLAGIPDVPPSTSRTIVNPPPTTGPIHHFAWNVNLTGDYKLSRHFALRAGIGEDLVRYRTDEVVRPDIGRPPYQSWLSKQNFISRGNWSYQLGPGIRSEKCR